MKITPASGLVGLHTFTIRATGVDVQSGAIVVGGTADNIVLSADSVNPITFEAASPFFENFLLPRRIADRPAPGVYIVCFECKSPYWDKRTHWLSPENGGGLVGLVYR